MNFEIYETAHHAFDKSFRFLADQHTGDMHLNLKLPGKFIRLLQNDVAKDPKSNIRMDLLELVGPDGDSITEETVINLEHQSTKLDSEKLEQISKYKDYSKCKFKNPILSAVATPFSPEEQKQEYKSTESDITKPKILCMDYKELQKRLNTLKRKINNNEKIENHTLLDFGIIAIFIRENKYPVLKELCELFKKAKNIPKELERDLVLVLESMIKTQLKNNNEQIRELLNMIGKDIETAKRGMRIYYEEEFAQIDAEHKKELTLKDVENKKIIAEKNLQLEKKDLEIEEKDLEIEEKNLKIEEKDLKIEEKDQTISKQEKEIKRLKEKLKENGIN